MHATCIPDNNRTGQTFCWLHREGCSIPSHPVISGCKGHTTTANDLKNRPKGFSERTTTQSHGQVQYCACWLPTTRTISCASTSASKRLLVTSPALLMKVCTVPSLSTVYCPRAATSAGSDMSHLVPCTWGSRACQHEKPAFILSVKVTPHKCGPPKCLADIVICTKMMLKKVQNTGVPRFRAILLAKHPLRPSLFAHCGRTAQAHRQPSRTLSP